MTEVSYIVQNGQKVYFKDTAGRELLTQKQVKLLREVIQKQQILKIYFCEAELLINYYHLIVFFII